MRSIPVSCRVLASALEPGDPVVCLPRGHSASVIYTTKATLVGEYDGCRKVTRTHRIFPSDEAVYKVVYLAMRTIAQKWTMPIHDWKPALNRFAVEFAERFPR